MDSMTAVVFGAGNVGCGLLGQLLWQAGLHTVFVARQPEIVAAINRARGYTLDVAGERIERVRVENCAALLAQARDHVIETVARADLVFTAVGIDNLTAITPTLAAALDRRDRAGHSRPLNIVACENLPGAGAYLRHQVVAASDPDRTLAVEHTGGFSAALTHRIMTSRRLDRDGLTLTVDTPPDLVVDRDGLQGDLPTLPQTTLTVDFPAVVTRKLFTLNCAHAAAAYLGYRAGCQTVDEAATHPQVAPLIQAALAEAAAALKAEYPDQAAGIDHDVADALRRIANPHLADPIQRVARSPRRKLSPRERLVGPGRLAHQHGLPYTALTQVIAAALAYDAPDDPQALALQQAIAAEGLERALTEDCGLLPHEDLARAIKTQWAALVGVPDAAGAPGDTLPGADARLAEIMGAVAADLERQYDPRLVQAVLVRVAEEFRQARVLTYVPILARREATRYLREVTR